MRRFTTLLTTILILTILYPISLEASKPDLRNQTLRVGAILPFSGELAYYGKAFQQGVQLALEEGLNKKITVFYEDDQSADRKTTISAARALMSKHDIHLILATGMPSIMVLDPIAHAQNILVFSTWDSNNHIQNLHKNSFGFGWSNEQTGEDLAEYAYQKLNSKKVAIITAHDEWSELISKAFSQRFSDVGGEVVLHEFVGLDNTDFRSLVLRIQKTSADTVYFPLYRASLLSFAKQISQSQFFGTLLSTEGITEHEIEQLGNLAEGMYVTQVQLRNTTFEEKYKKRFNLDKAELNLAHVALGYDAIHYLNACTAELEKQQKAITVKNLRETLPQISFDGILGTSKITAGRSVKRGQQILLVQNGKFVLAP